MTKDNEDNPIARDRVEILDWDQLPVIPSSL